ncbi:replication-relaxation family protein [Streptomyces sp. 8L]|uniref:replication-relaxation family protein n=1 Tax=Streptomyces sp. 8L TaxID=2877242 RepID=UPI001CD74883|nr:replication-relaxation family protein [Streptomyces sp. 8L]MCA1221399.1 replication-relaxation family protein [Streptomyces sp. 8L]
MTNQQQAWPYKSTSRVRGLVLMALGVVKVATVRQLRHLVLPGTANLQTVRNAAKDLREAGLTESVGRTHRPGGGGKRVAQDLWTLTQAGLAAAASELGRPIKEMGGTAREAAKAGAAHSLAVTDVIDAILQTPPLPTNPVARRTSPVVSRPRQLPSRPQGLGHLRGWWTEVALPVHGTFTTPARGSLRADALLSAVEDDVPVLFVEVDRQTEPPALVAQKIATYRQFFRRQLPDPRGRNIPMWATQWPAPGLASHPPLALVFAEDASDSALQRRVNAIREASRDHWTAPWTSYEGRRPDAREDDGWREYKDVVPVITTTLTLLREHGPHGPVWTRFGRSRPHPLLNALTHHNTETDFHDREERRRATKAQADPAGWA